jgi:hypothetical protein
MAQRISLNRWRVCSLQPGPPVLPGNTWALHARPCGDGPGPSLAASQCEQRAGAAMTYRWPEVGKPAQANLTRPAINERVETRGWQPDMQ